MYRVIINLDGWIIDVFFCISDNILQNKIDWHSNLKETIGAADLIFTIFIKCTLKPLLLSFKLISPYWRHIATEITGNNCTDNGFLIWRHQATTWTSVDVIYFWPLYRYNFTENAQDMQAKLSFRFSSSPTSAAYMLKWIMSALVQIMSCRAYSAPSHYLNQCWVIVNWTLVFRI